METYDFGELGLQEQQGNGRPAGDYHNIDQVINTAIWVTGVINDIDTDNGKRTLVKFKWDLQEAETAFFTSSKKLSSVLNNPKCKFPFHTIIKVVLVRDMTGFEFRSAKEAISQEDENNLNLYLHHKRNFLKRR